MGECSPIYRKCSVITGQGGTHWWRWVDREGCTEVIWSGPFLVPRVRQWVCMKKTQKYEWAKYIQGTVRKSVWLIIMLRWRWSKRRSKKFAESGLCEALSAVLNHSRYSHVCTLESLGELFKIPRPRPMKGTKLLPPQTVSFKTKDSERTFDTPSPTFSA